MPDTPDRHMRRTTDPETDDPEDEKQERISRWREFTAARAFARTLGLLGQTEWYAYCRGDLKRFVGTRPPDIPSCPNREYKDEGWAGNRDWLGPPPLEPVVPGFVRFDRAKRYARTLRLGDSEDWRQWVRGGLPGKRPRPANIPEDPERVYPRAWRGWRDWLGTERRERKAGSRFLPFDEARAFARSLGLADVKEWREFCRGQREDLGRRPKEVPATPDNAYRFEGWDGYGDWLGSGRISVREMPPMPFEEARAVVRPLGLASADEFISWLHGERPDLPPPPVGISTNPHRVYADSGWTTWGDFLGSGFVALYLRTYVPFDEARAYARSLGLRGHLDWLDVVHGERPDLPPPPGDLPACPDVHYRECGWTHWGDFLGTGRVPPGSRTWRSFEDARAFARTLGLASVEEWRAYCAGEFAGHAPRPDDIPANVEGHYRDSGWHGWPDFLGHRRQLHRRMPYEEARELVRRLGLRDRSEWRDWVTRQRDDLPDPPGDLPVSPSTAYKGRGWKGWCDFLGARVRTRAARDWPPFEEARAFARTLALGSRPEWVRLRLDMDHSALSDRLREFPGGPHIIYADKGWNGWSDFLGYEPKRRRSVRPPPRSADPVDRGEDRLDAGESHP